MGDPLGSPRVASLLFAAGPSESDRTVYIYIYIFFPAIRSEEFADAHELAGEAREK